MDFDTQIDLFNVKTSKTSEDAKFCCIICFLNYRTNVEKMSSIGLRASRVIRVSRASRHTGFTFLQFGPIWWGKKFNLKVRFFGKS